MNSLRRNGVFVTHIESQISNLLRNRRPSVVHDHSPLWHIRSVDRRPGSLYPTLKEKVSQQSVNLLYYLFLVSRSLRVVYPEQKEEGFSLIQTDRTCTHGSVDSKGLHVPDGLERVPRRPKPTNEARSPTNRGPTNPSLPLQQLSVKTKR